MAAVTICSDFGATKIKSDTVSTVSPSISQKWWDRMPWSSLSECWVLSQQLDYNCSKMSRTWWNAYFDWYFESSRCHQESKLASLQNKILSLTKIKEEGKRKWLPKLPALPPWTCAHSNLSPFSYTAYTSPKLSASPHWSLIQVAFFGWNSPHIFSYWTYQNISLKT